MLSTPTSPSPFRYAARVQARLPGDGLALAALVLALVGLCASPLVVGAGLALPALVCALAALLRGTRHAGRAWAGLLLASAALAVSAGAGYLYLRAYQRWPQRPATSHAPRVPRARRDARTSGPSDLDAWLGVRAPELRLETLDGETLDIQALRGRRVLLNFWATWCPPCRQEIPDFVRLASEAERHDVVVIGISDERSDVLSRFARANGMRYPLVSLGPWPEPFDAVVALPTTVVIDRRGAIESVHRGTLDYDELVTLASAPDSPDVPRDRPD